MNYQTKAKLHLTKQRLERDRRDKLYELVRLSKMLWAPPWSRPNGVMPLYLDEWRDSVASVALVGHRTRSAGTCGEPKDLRLKAAIKKGGWVVKNKVRDRLLLWERFLFLLAQLREGEFVSCYCRGNWEVVWLTILDFPSIIVPTRVLERVAKHLLPKGGEGLVRLRTKKKKRRENHPRFRRWMEKLPRYLDETWFGEPAEAVQEIDDGAATAAELERTCQRPDGTGRRWVFSPNGSSGEIGAKKSTKKKARRTTAKKVVPKPVARAKTTRPIGRKKVA